MPKKPLSRRQLLRLARNTSGPLALALTMLDKPFSWFFQWDKNTRERKQFEWARADRQHGQVVELRGTISGKANLSVGTITVKGRGTVAPPDPTIPI